MNWVEYVEQSLVRIKFVSAEIFLYAVTGTNVTLSNVSETVANLYRQPQSLAETLQPQVGLESSFG